MQENNINPDSMGNQPVSDGENKKKPDEEIQPENSSNKELENKSESPLTSPDKESDTHFPSEEKTKHSFSEENPESKSELPVIPPIKPKPTSSNYQISLINENLLKVVVLTKRGVKINSSVKEMKTSIETQSNEIYLYPKLDYALQETEVLISIEDPKTEKTEIDEASADEKTGSSKSYYQINLINENLLKIKIETDSGVEINSVAKDKRTLVQTQSNRIFLQPKSEGELQEVEIKIEIELEKKDFKDEVSGNAPDGQIRFVPNPEVVDLIQPPDYSTLMPGEEDYRQESSIFKNPFDAFRKSIRKNLVIGIIAAVALHGVAAAVFFYSTSKKSKEQGQEEPSRLIVIQDLPDPKIKLEDIEDPNKPKIEKVVPPIENPDAEEERKREIPPRKIVRPPEVIRPDKEEEEKLDSLIESEITRELDSLRKLLAENTTPDTTATNADTSAAINYEIPDSLRNSFNENDIGLAMYFPKNWKLTDQREINKSEKEFKGVLLTDTTAEQPGTMTMFIYLDPENKDFNAEDFKTEFKMNDSTLNAFSKEPKTLAGFSEYRFYIFNKLGTEKLSLRASVRKQYFDQYKNEIEAVVRSISIKKKEDM